MKRVSIFLAIATLNILISSDLDIYLKSLEEQVKKVEPDFKGFSIQRGKDIFFSKHIGKRGKEISCSSCHTENLRSIGENIFTGKKLEPLSPAVNPKRLKDIKRVKKWLKRNFKDVYNRGGHSQKEERGCA